MQSSIRSSEAAAAEEEIRLQQRYTSKVALLFQFLFAYSDAAAAAVTFVDPILSWLLLLLLLLFVNRDIPSYIATPQPPTPSSPLDKSIFFLLLLDCCFIIIKTERLN